MSSFDVQCGTSLHYSTDVFHLGEGAHSLKSHNQNGCAATCCSVSSSDAGQTGNKDKWILQSESIFSWPEVYDGTNQHPRASWPAQEQEAAARSAAVRAVSSELDIISISFLKKEEK